jgi:hypothetical protein
MPEEALPINAYISGGLEKWFPYFLLTLPKNGLGIPQMRFLNKRGMRLKKVI